MGADSLCIKDMAGIISPYDSYELVSRLKESICIPVHLHTHYTSGMASMSISKAIEAGADGMIHASRLFPTFLTFGLWSLSSSH